MCVSKVIAVWPDWVNRLYINLCQGEPATVANDIGAIIRHIER